MACRWGIPAWELNHLSGVQGTIRRPGPDAIAAAPPYSRWPAPGQLNPHAQQGGRPRMAVPPLASGGQRRMLSPDRSCPGSPTAPPAHPVPSGILPRPPWVISTRRGAEPSTPQSPAQLKQALARSRTTYRRCAKRLWGQPNPGSQAAGDFPGSALPHRGCVYIPRPRRVEHPRGRRLEMTFSGAPFPRASSPRDEVPHGSWRYQRKVGVLGATVYVGVAGGARRVAIKRLPQLARDLNSCRCSSMRRVWQVVSATGAISSRWCSGHGFRPWGRPLGLFAEISDRRKQVVLDRSANRLMARPERTLPMRSTAKTACRSSSFTGTFRRTTSWRPGWRNPHSGRIAVAMGRSSTVRSPGKLAYMAQSSWNRGPRTGGWMRTRRASFIAVNWSTVLPHRGRGDRRSRSHGLYRPAGSDRD